MKKNIQSDSFQTCGTKQSHRYYSLFIGKKAKGNSLTKLPVSAKNKNAKNKINFSHNFFEKTNKVFLYTSDVVFRNYKSYLYTLLLPLIIVFTIFLFRTNFHTLIDQYNFPLMFLIPSITLIIFFSSLLLDWRKSTFIKQMTNFGVSKYSFVLGFTITSFLCSLMATAFGIIYIYIFCVLSGDEYNSFKNWANYLTSGVQVLGLIISIFFSSIITAFVAILFTGWLKNIYVIQTVNIVLIVVFLGLSDILASPELTSQVEAMCIVSYFDPYKYVSWITLMLNGKMDKSFYYVYFFVKDIDSYISFNEIWQPIIGSIGFAALIGGLSTLLFTVSTKK